MSVSAELRRRADALYHMADRIDAGKAPMPYVQSWPSGNKAEAVKARQAVMIDAYHRLGSYAAAARFLGCSHHAVMWAVNPDWAEKKREAARFRYYLNKVLPKELDAEAAE